MSTSPSAARLSRRSLLRGAASVGVAAVLAPVAGCATDETATAPEVGETAPEATGSDLLRLGHLLADGPDGAGLVAARPASLTDITSDADVVGTIATLDAENRADAAAGRSVVGDGWLLGTTEAAVLVAYAETCSLPSC